MRRVLILILWWFNKKIQQFLSLHNILKTCTFVISVSTSLPRGNQGWRLTVRNQIQNGSNDLWQLTREKVILMLPRGVTLWRCEKCLHKKHASLYAPRVTTMRVAKKQNLGVHTSLCGALLSWRCGVHALFASCSSQNLSKQPCAIDKRKSKSKIKNTHLKK